MSTFIVVEQATGLALSAQVQPISFLHSTWFVPRFLLLDVLSTDSVAGTQLKQFGVKLLVVAVGPPTLLSLDHVD